MGDQVGSHGTRVAGVIAAVGNNKVGVVGVNWQVSLIACKAFDSNFKGGDATIVACLNYAQTLKQQGVNIVATVAAWGGAPPSQALYDAIAAQMKVGILFVTAAGNNPIDQDIDGVNLYPADFDLPKHHRGFGYRSKR
jgi:subtilisin family serine protease